MLTNVLSCQDDRAEFGNDADADLFHGRVIGINDVVDFYGKDIEDLKREFKTSIEEYLDDCRALGQKPEKTYPPPHRGTAPPLRRRGRDGAQAPERLDGRTLDRAGLKAEEAAVPAE